MGLLLLQMLALISTREAPTGGSWILLVGIALLLQLARLTLGVPLRAAVLAAGARVLAHPTKGWRAVPSLWVVHLTIAAMQTLGAALFVLPGLAAASYLALRGWLVLGPVILTAAVLLGAVVSLLIGSVFAYAPMESVVGRRGPLASLLESLRTTRGERIQLAALLLCGELATGLGALLCGAGALPGYPMADLAVLHRWSSGRPEPS